MTIYVAHRLFAIRYSQQYELSDRETNLNDSINMYKRIMSHKKEKRMEWQ